MFAGALWAGPKVNLEKKGTYVYWFTYKDAAGVDQVTLPQRFKGKSGLLDVKALGPAFTGAKLYVMDKRSSNLAITDYAAPKDPKSEKPIELGSDDFSYVREVQLRITAEDGAPLESAVVTITDGDGAIKRALVTPADGGVASFENVSAGEINVKVDANGLKRTIDSDIELPEKRDKPGFQADVKVAGDVETLPVESAGRSTGADKDHSAPKPEKGQSAVGFILQYVAGLFLLVVILAVVYVVIKAKGLTAGEALKKIGVEFPGDRNAAEPGVPAQPVAPAVDPNVCEFCGQKKDASGNCSCSVAPGASPFGAPAAVAGCSPRLIGTQGTYSGHIFDLSSPSCVVGREPTNGVALPNDTTASRRHATITLSDGGCVIRDEGSSNGTFVNGAKITEQKLTSGDEIQVGGTKFRFEA